MATMYFLFSVIIPGLVIAAIIAALVMVTRGIIQRHRVSLRLGIERTYERLGFEDPEAHDGHLLRSKGTVGGIEGCFIDARYATQGLAVIDLTLHVPLQALGIPKGVSLEVTSLSHQPPPVRSAEGTYMNRVLSTDSTITLGWNKHALTGPIGELLGVASPDAHAKLTELDAFYTEPLTALLIEGDWVVLKRSVTQQAMSSRQAKEGEGLEIFLTQLVQQTSELARSFSWDWERPEDLYEALFMRSSPFTPHREQALSTLLTTFRGSEASERIWSFALERGNLHDVVLAINTDQARALDEITDDRFVTFVNTLIDSSDAFDVSALPNLAAQRFDYSALLNTRMSWGMRKALLMLWLGTIDPSHDEFNAHIAKLPTTLRPSERRELLDVFTKQPSTASQSIAPVYASWVAAGEPIEHSELQALMAAYVALARSLDEQRLDAIARENEIEPLLIVILERNLQVASAAARALGSFGSAAAIPALTDIIERSGQTLVGQGAEAKAAREAVVERLRRDPTSGGLSVSVEPDARGALSRAEGEAGGLALAPPDDESGA